MKISSTQPAVLFAWYSREDWERLRDVAPDREELDATFDEWELAAVESELQLQLKGVSVTRVWIKAEAFLEWCREHKCPASRASRSQFAMVASQLQFGAEG